MTTSQIHRCKQPSWELQLANAREATERLDREIALVSEYRTCLIADVVTGKLDVRAAAAQIPDEPREDEHLEEAEPFEEEDLLEPDRADA